METINNNQKPATKRQLWALCLASKNAGEARDYRNDNLTFEQAAQLLKQFNEKTGYTKQPTSRREYKPAATSAKSKQEQLEEKIKKYFIEFFKDKYLDRYIKNLSGVLNQVSEVYSADAFGNDIGGRRYIFFGSGCSVAWLKYRKCRKYETIYDVTRKALHEDCFKMICEKVGKDLCDKLTQLGSPLSAIIYQDYSFNQLSMQCLKEFLELNGAKNVQIQVWYD